MAMSIDAALSEITVVAPRVPGSTVTEKATSKHCPNGLRWG